MIKDIESKNVRPTFYQDYNNVCQVIKELNEMNNEHVWVMLINTNNIMTSHTIYIVCRGQRLLLETYSKGGHRNINVGTRGNYGILKKARECFNKLIEQHK